MKTMDMLKQLEITDREVVNKADELRTLLRRLTYIVDEEACRPVLSELSGVLDFFAEEIFVHQRLEENVLFPFLKVHIPRLEHTIHLLYAEHRDFRRDFTTIRNLYQRLLIAKRLSVRSDIITKLYTIGSCFLYLLRYHAEVESQYIHDAVQIELLEEERAILEERLCQYAADNMQEGRPWKRISRRHKNAQLLLSK